MIRKTLPFTLGLALVFVFLGTPLRADVAPSGKTLDNLQAAFIGESNARVRYLAFAKKADADGLAPVASLFRAAARAEEIHAASHAVVIQKLGAVPQANIEEPTVGSTKENLAAAIKGESYERDTMYPEFIRVAASERQSDALKSFSYAKAAEAEHAKLYTSALGASTPRPDLP
jgi:rubrerythrin